MFPAARLLRIGGSAGAAYAMRVDHPDASAGPGMPVGRIAGIDFGTVRIGIAIADARVGIASPYENYSRRSAEADAAKFCRLVADEALYAASVLDIVARLREVAPGNERVLVVGHEPSMSGVVQHLAGARVVYPTGALARIDLEPAEWSGITEGRGELAWLLPPRLLEDVLGRLD